MLFIFNNNDINTSPGAVDVNERFNYTKVNKYNCQSYKTISN